MTFERTVASMRTGSLRVVAVGAVMVGLSACGTETPTEYSAENQEAFMASCVDASVDGIFQQRVCLCVYEQAEANISFDRFLEIEEQFDDVEDPGLPEDLLALVSQCVIEEGDL